MEKEKIQEVTKSVKNAAQDLSKKLDQATSGLLPKRFFASFIDICLIGVVSALLCALGLFILPSVVFQIYNAVILFVAGAAVLLKDGPYDLGFDAKQSIGKRAMNLVVKKTTGETITYNDSVRRNLILGLPFFLSGTLSILQVLSFMPIIGLIFGLGIFFLYLLTGLLSLALFAFEIYTMVKDPDKRRWGDISANTIVRME